MGMTIATGAIVLAGLFGSSPADCIKDVDENFSMQKSIIQKRIYMARKDYDSWDAARLEKFCNGNYLCQFELVAEKNKIIDDLQDDLRRLESSYVFRVKACGKG